MKNNQNIRTFNFSNWAIDNKYTVYVVIFILTFTGFISYMSMPRETFPDLVIPRIYIGTAYPGNSPIDVERLITKPLEKEVNSISGISKMTSSSMQGYSIIDVEFDFSITPEEALRKVKDKIDLAMSNPDFPTDLPSDPNVMELNISELTPIMNVNISGDFKLSDLEKYAKILQDKIEALSEIKEVDIRGIGNKEVEIKIDLYKMETTEISFQDVENSIKQENITMSAGDVLSNGRRTAIRVLGEFTDIEQIGNIIVKRENQKIVYLKDIAKIEYREKDKETYSREYKKSVVTLDVKKKAGENLIVVSDQIKKIIEQEKARDFPSNLLVTITNDLSDNTGAQVKDLENSIVFGVILVVLVLMFFLGLRNALFVGVAIPLSMLMSFMILNFMGITLNTIVLFALVIALGMLVDNGIVVTENIYSLLQKGYSLLEATRQGVGEVAWPIISSTATTLAAFLPLAMWPGIIGEFMKYMPLTLIIVLGSSLFVALFITPVLTSIFMKLEEKKPDVKRIIKKRGIFFVLGIGLFILGTFVESDFLRVVGNTISISIFLWVIYAKWLYRFIQWFQRDFMLYMEDEYEKILEIFTKGRNAYKTFFGSFVALIMSVVIFSIFPPKVEFFPSSDPDQIIIYAELPHGTDIEETNVFTKELEDKVYNYISRYQISEKTQNNVDTTYNFLIKSVIAQVGEGASHPDDGMETGIPNKSKITISFVETEYRRGMNTSHVIEEIRKEIGTYPGASIIIDKNQNGPPTQAPINIEIVGDDYKKIFKTAEDLKSFIERQKDIKGIENLVPDVNIDKPEINIDIDRDRARMYNLSTMEIASGIRTALYGKEVSRYKIDTDDDSYEINIKLDDKYRYNIETLLNQKITFRDANSGKISQVPISSIVSSRPTASFSSVKRKKMQRMIILSSNVLEGYNANIVVNEIRKRIKDFSYDRENIKIRFTGEQEEQAKEMAFLSEALLLAVFLIFLILVMQFNSVLAPMVVLSSVVLSFMGVFYGLAITRMNFIIIMTMIGIISLAGVVVNNAIVLIDYTKFLTLRAKNRLNKEHLNKEEVFECIVAAGRSRLRPVLLTAITTVLGLLPMATGMNINFYGILLNYNPEIYFGGGNVSFWGPLAWTIIFGLTFATFLTLIVVPTMYYLLMRMNIRFGNKKLVKK